MKIRLQHINLYAYHGVLPQERAVGCWYEVNVTLETDNIKAAESDDIKDTINYATVYELIKQEMNKPSKLIEHVAGRIGKRILGSFPTCDAVTVRIAKKNPPVCAAGMEAVVELTLHK